MDLIIIVVGIVVLVSLVVVMFRYAGFIHQGPSVRGDEDDPRKDETDDSSRDNRE